MKDDTQSPHVDWRITVNKCQCCSHIEISQLICTAIQLTGFYMSATLVLNELKKHGIDNVYIPLCVLVCVVHNKTIVRYLV